jgi:GAF domain-containing protein
VVIPLLLGAELLGVLDLDSPKHARFKPSDARGLERLARVFVDSLGLSPLANYSDLPREM